MIKNVGILDTHKSAVKHEKLVRDEKQLDTGLIGFLENLIVKS